MPKSEFKHYLNDFSNSLKALNGTFSLNNLSSQLFFGEAEMYDKIHIYFHERYHYLQTIFTSYGHLKWGMHRTQTSEIVNFWKELYKLNGNKGFVSAYYYLDGCNKNTLNSLVKIYLNDQARIMADLSSTNYIPDLILSNNPELKKQLPKIVFNGKEIELTDLYVLESYAKFEEALFRNIVFDVPIEETINPDILHPKYYLLINYFIEKIGIDRLLEFPVVCEIALSIEHIPQKNNISDYHPGSRFLKVVDYLSQHPEIKLHSFTDDASFLSYVNHIFKGCNYPSWDDVWREAYEYASSSNLTISKEMLKAIDYKRKNPRALSYALFDEKILLSDEYTSFHPLFTITDDGVLYLSNVSEQELFFENNYQAFALQITGNYSKKRCKYTYMLQCGDSYFGLNQCPYSLNGVCDGHIDKDSELLNIEISNNTLQRGCQFELFLRVIDVSLKNIEVIDTGKKIEYADLLKAKNKIK